METCGFCYTPVADSPLVVEALLIDLMTRHVGVLRDRSSARPKWLSTLLDYLDDTFDQEWSLAGMAAEIGVHPVYLCRAFSEHFGCTLGEYIRKLRVLRAWQLGAAAELDDPEGLAAGLIEFFGGGLILIGLFTPIAAFVASGEMAVAYFKAHAPRGFWPILNRGELAALYCFAFLFISCQGDGAFGAGALWRRLATTRNRQKGGAIPPPPPAL